MKKQTIKKRKPKKSWYIIWFIIFAFFAAAVLTVFITLPLFRINNVFVVGTRLMSPDEILRLADIPQGENLFLVRFNKAKQRLINIPVIKQVDFKRKLFSTVQIKIKERKEAVICVVKNQSLILDDKGVVMNPEGVMGVGISFPDITNLPVISGLDSSWLENGLAIKSDKGKELLAMLAEFKTLVLPQKLQIDIAKNDDVKLLVDDILDIRIGKLEGLSSKVKIFNAIYSKVKDRKYDIAYIDVSSPLFPAVKFK